MSEMNNNNETTVVSDKPKQHLFRASAANFKKIPGSPIAYWVSEKLRNIFSEKSCNVDISSFQGMATTDNSKFMRSWYEVSIINAGFSLNREEAHQSKKKWFPYNKGGSLRKWYGNQEFVVNWLNEGESIISSAVEKYPYLKGNVSYVVKESNPYFSQSISWTDLTTKGLSARYYPKGFLFDVSGHSAFPSKEKCSIILCYLNSSLANEFTKILNPSFHFQVGDFRNLPYPGKVDGKDLDFIAQSAVETSKTDWNSYETSWDFTETPLIRQKQSTLKAAFELWETQNCVAILETQRLEQENNRIFIDAYGLQDELTPGVPLNEITLTCNPHYRYGNNKTEAELETLLLADTLKEFISYAVGCMFGRYALDKPGLILANQGETIADYLKQIPEPIFSADDDNVIPMLDGDWFTDDVTERFGQFLKVTFGDAHYEENLKFIEQALGKDIRKYFLKDFYIDHLKRYKKRPIYWLFSSPNGTFNALIYMHRYRPDTVSVVLNDYLREFRTKLSAHKNHLEAVSISSNASAGEKTKALKEIENHRKMIDELDTYEREVLYPLATEQIEIDLDDGVKVNYQKFGEALKKIPGLAAKEE